MSNLIHPSDITLSDDFCGCGGSTQGAKQVKGVRVKYARNHWKLAVDSHNTNHPDTDHDCVNISETHPARYERTNIYIASPECTYHSQAGGRKTKNLAQTDLFSPQVFDEKAVKSRATMWDVVTFAEYHRHDVVIIENVVRVRAWPLFDTWLKAMHKLGYLHECVYMNAMFAHGPDIVHYTPQSRDRIYIVFWRKGNKKPNLRFTPKAPCIRCGVVEAVQSWKPGCIDKTYGPKGGYVYRCPNCYQEVLPYYYAAVNCLDLSIPMVKIGDRVANKMAPLSPNTIARIEYGLKKYGLRPTILDQRNQHGSLGSRIRGAETEVLNAQTTGFSSYLFAPFLFNMSHTKSAHKAYGLDEALFTQTTQQSAGLAMPGFMPIHRGKSLTHQLTDPLSTVSAGGIHSSIVLAPSAILTMRGSRSLDGITDPLAAQTTSIQNWLMSATPFLTPYHGVNNARLATDPVSTIPTKDSVSLVEAHNQPDINECYFRMLQPKETAKAQGFPDDYVILGNKEDQQIQIGNANPPSTMEWLVGRAVESLL